MYTHIQFLRAFAVVAVIIFHIKESLLPSGYLGVDMFFVISGFVITKSIATALQDNTFSLLNFYEKRIRRIFPALFVMLIVSFVVFLSIATYHEFEILYEAKPWYSSLQISNWSFMYHRGDYWNPVTQTIFLHTWSLGVEEQFYLVYPLLVLLIFWSKGKSFSYILWLSIFSLISLYFFITLPSQIAFYSPFARGYQFLIGGISYYIYNLYLKDKINSNSILLSVILSILYYFMIILLLIMVFLSKNTIQNLSIYITILTAMVILLGCFSNHKFIANSKISLGIGNMSYSLYLWHFPIIIIYKMLHLTLTGRELQVLDCIVIGLIIFVFSILSYQYIEQPFRKKSKSKKSVAMVFIIAIVISLGTSYAFSIPYHNKLKILIKDGDNNRKREIDWRNNWKKIDNKSDKSVLFIGNSHAEERIAAMVSWAEKNKLNISIATVGGFNNLLQFQNRNKFILKALSDERLTTVVILAYVNRINFLNEIIEIRPNLEFIVLEDSPLLLYHAFKCVRANTTLSKYFSFLSPYLSGDKCMIINTKKFEQSREKLLKEVEELQKKGINIVFIKNKVEQLKYKGQWTYRDAEHLNSNGMKYIEEGNLLDFKSMYSPK